ncbi:MAG: tRNA lysidine(34) synthetase TilS [Lachnospiraceae bacterium]|nr:tRNA lysidine(34) synthetase TilS [Lachnospiraceae bacterium]
MVNKKTEDIYAKVKKYTQDHKMISDRDVILIGVSGGADSVCLLVMLSQLSKEINFDLIAVHVHHGIREDADDDAAYVGELCKKLDIPFFLKKVDMAGYAKEMGLSPEEAGRKLRYQAFESVIEEVFETNKADGRSKEHYKIAVAHNNNDRAETMLFNLFRGSGLRGLGSIRPVRDNIIRPLLCLERTEIEAYLNQGKIAYCIDSTNEDDTYTRNKIRHHILPFAEEQICNNATAHISDAAEVLAQTQDFIQKQSTLAYERCVIRDAKEICDEAINRNVDETCNENEEKHKQDENRIILNMNIFLAEEQFIQRLILLLCMEKLTPHRKDITKEHIASLLELCSKDGSKELFLPYGLTARKEYDKFVIFRKSESTVENMQDLREYPPIPISVPSEVTARGLGILEFKYLKKEEFFYKKGEIIPEKRYTKWFDCDKITKVIVLRTRETGDYLTIDSALRKKSVKEYMINEKIPKGQRDSLYLLADGAHIMWIPGYRISQYYKVDENTKCILQVRLKENDNG